MKTISKAMMAVGFLVAVGAACNDELYGPAYPLHELMITVGIAVVLMIGGLALNMKGDE